MKKDKSINKFRFSEDEPTPIVRDFKAFINYMEDNSPLKMGGSRGNLSYKDLVALNELMSSPNTENTPRTPERFYPQLSLFHQIALAGGLFQKVPKGSSIVLEPTERLDSYRSLSDASKYFFLLETLWVDCSLKEISFDDTRGRIIGIEHGIENIMQLLSKSNPGQKNASQQVRMLWHLIDGALLLALPFFGWYEIVRDTQFDRTKSFVIPESLTPSHLGVAISKILLKERPFTLWNIPYRKTVGEMVDFPGQDPEAEGDYVPFFEAFRKICEDGESLETLPRRKREIIKGNFIFKVSLSGEVWRTIGLSGEHTLYHLHRAIQEAFRFDDDHLYAFYMDNRRWSEYCFNDPRSEEGPFADEIKIRDLDLVVNQSFMYIFDFGDEWTFDIKLIEIQTDKPLILQPKIIKKKGRSPDQYGYYDY